MTTAQPLQAVNNISESEDSSFILSLGDFLSSATHSKVIIKKITLLSGGAIQNNHLLTLQVEDGEYKGEHEWVVRSDANTSISESLSRQQEYQLLSYAYEHGVKVAKPLWYGDESHFGHAFFVMEKANGITRPAHLVNPKRFTLDREQLTTQLGEQLARIHRLNDHESLSFLHRSDIHPATFCLNQYQDYLATLNEGYPILELALRQLQLHLPKVTKTVLCHRDYRVGNIMADEAGLTAILDWEFCAWSDYHEDIAWFCAPCWRFGQRDKAAGGLADRSVFYRAYEQHSGFSINPSHIRFWEAFATLRWAIIAIEQGYRHLSKEPSLELALTAHIVPELELDLLNMLEESLA